VGRVKCVLVILDSRVMCVGRVSSWKRMKFVRESNICERESRVCGDSEVCIGDFRLARVMCERKLWLGL